MKTTKKSLFFFLLCLMLCLLSVPVSAKTTSKKWTNKELEQVRLYCENASYYASKARDYSSSHYSYMSYCEKYLQKAVKLAKKKNSFKTYDKKDFLSTLKKAYKDAKKAKAFRPSGTGYDYQISLSSRKIKDAYVASACSKLALYISTYILSR